MTEPLDTPTPANAVPGHNRPPVSAPSEDDVLEDLKVRHPNVESRLAAFEASAKDFPEKIKDEETDKVLTDLLKQIRLEVAKWKAARGVEKSTWSVLADTAFNYFKTPEDKATALFKDLDKRHTQWLEDKKAVEEQRRKDELEKQRLAAEAARQAAEKAAERQRLAEEAEREALARAAAAEKAAEEARERQRLAEEEARAAAAEAKRQDEERRQREREEKEANADAMRTLKTLLRSAGRLHAKIENGPDIADGEEEELGQLLDPAGALWQAGVKLGATALLDDDQKTDLEEQRVVLRDIMDKRKVRLKAADDERHRKAEEEAQAKAVARAVGNICLAYATFLLHRARAQAEAAAAAAKTEVKEAKKEDREARADARDSFAESKDAARTGRVLSGTADREERRVDRAEAKLENATDADLTRSRTGRGTVTSLSGRWVVRVVDRMAFMQHFGPNADSPYPHLGHLLNPDAADAAAWKWMRENQGTFVGDFVEGKFPGVVFDFEPESRIK